MQADEVSIDPDDRVVEARGNVRVDAEPFHLQSDALTLTRSWRGIELDGAGRLSFCKCLAFPLALSFRGGAVGPPHDLLLEKVKLELFQVPLFYLPVLWLRTPARIGALMPELSYRGADGVYGSLGVHLPLRSGSLREGLDLRLGGYSRGGVLFGAQLDTERTRLSLQLEYVRAFAPDRLAVGGFGAQLDGRGVVGGERGRAWMAAWDVDARIGARARYHALSLEAAARPYDRARAESALLGRHLALAFGARALTPRGHALAPLLFGPHAYLGARGAWSERSTAHAGLELGVYGVHRGDGGASPWLAAEAPKSLHSARAEFGATLSEHAGPWLAELRLQGAAHALHAEYARAQPPASPMGYALALDVGLSWPLVRGFGDAQWPLRHRLEPRLGARALSVRGRGDESLGAAAGRGLQAVRGEALVAELSVLSALGRLGSHAAWELEVASGTLLHEVQPDAARGLQPALRARSAASSRWLSLQLEAARTFAGWRPSHAGAGESGELGDGAALLLHGRLGPRDRLHLRTRFAHSRGASPLAARLLVDPQREAPTGYTHRPGETLGAALHVPWTQWLSSEFGADVDLSAERLLGARGALELRDRCGCFAVRLSGSQRIGREGVDVWLAVDFMPNGKR